MGSKIIAVQVGGGAVLVGALKMEMTTRDGLLEDADPDIEPELPILDEDVAELLDVEPTIEDIEGTLEDIEPELPVLEDDLVDDLTVDNLEGESLLEDDVQDVEPELPFLDHDAIELLEVEPGLFLLDDADELLDIEPELPTLENNNVDTDPELSVLIDELQSDTLDDTDVENNQSSSS
eukprot:gene831-962_t